MYRSEEFRNLIKDLSSEQLDEVIRFLLETLIEQTE